MKRTTEAMDVTTPMVTKIPAAAPLLSRIPLDCSFPCDGKFGFAAISVWITRSPSGSVEVLRIVTNKGVEVITEPSLVIVTGIALDSVVSGSTNSVLVDEERDRADGGTTTTEVTVLAGAEVGGLEGGD